MLDKNIEEILNSFSKMQRNKIFDYLISEIGEDNLQETIDFIKCDDNLRKRKFSDILYNGEDYPNQEYIGNYLDGNQYLVTSTAKEVTIIDALSREHGVADEYVILKMPIEIFITLIKNKYEVIRLEM